MFSFPALFPAPELREGCPTQVGAAEQTVLYVWWDCFHMSWWRPREFVLSIPMRLGCGRCEKVGVGALWSYVQQVTVHIGVTLCLSRPRQKIARSGERVVAGR
jgi:hypothetical protein